MPYTKKDFTLIANKNAINAYTRLAQIILYHKEYDKDKINDILDELLNKYTLPVIGAMVYTTRKNKKEIIHQAYVKDLFGDNFEDYQYQMRNFSNDAMIKPITDDKELSNLIQNGFNLVTQYTKAIIAQLIPETFNKQESYAILKDTLEREINKL